MLFETLNGNKVNVALSQYKIDWRKKSLSKFQTRIKTFFWKYYKHLDWYEEVPLAGSSISRLRWDFVCTFDKGAGRECVFVECDGLAHDKFSPHFHGTIEKFEEQMVRDGLKELFAEKNSKYPVIRIYEEDEPVTLKWFLEEFGEVLPSKTI